MNAKCDDKDLGEATKKFDSSEFKANDTEVQLVNLHNVNVANFCNQIFEIKDALKCKIPKIDPRFGSSIECGDGSLSCLINWSKYLHL